MKFIPATIVSGLCLLALYNCKPKTEQETTTLPSATSNDIAEPVVRTTNNIIQYTSAVDDNIKSVLKTFPPLAQVCSLASQSIHIKDSIETTRQTERLTDAKDSLIFASYEHQAYQAILEYQQTMATGITLQDACPSLIQLNRTTDPGDSTSSILPPVKESKVLTKGDFFFLGGAPFISKRLQDDNNTVFTDPQGNPETRFGTTTSENTNYLLNSIYHFKKEPTKVTFGPPLDSYDSGPQEVKGIGSLIHEFVNRIPVYFLTEKGPVPAHLISVTIKLVPEYLGCVSDQPRIEFACPQSLEENDILAIYIPYNTTPLTSCTINRPNNTLWTADINGDGIPEIACVSGTFEGISDDKMAESLWFININGSWQIIDGAEELDCT